ncbi:MAG: RNA polymerase sporulation sigma factor SigK [Oscillospiraceae bacterium]|jgi:RNA polymerase sporulation-specific sigma factor|nr:RNA polymerase sporulation sigma factor SigK [Oscillospiraceae bacterium]
MISAALALFFTSPFLMLRMSDGGGAFQKPLSPAEEREYIDRMIAGDADARRVLIERNLRLVAHIMKKYYTQENDKEDLISIGTIGLIKGISTYNPEKKVHLSTYASRCIENEILMHFRGRKKSGGDVSLSDPIDTDREGNALTLIDLISVEDDMLESISAEETRSRLERYIRESLTPRESEIIAQRYGLRGLAPRTQREVAAERGISRSYVSRIEKKALEKLRERFLDEDV